MKRILSIATVIAATIIAASSCSKAEREFAGSDGEVTYSMGHYMMCIANNLIVDNLKILEYKIKGKANIQSKTSVMTPDDPSYRIPGVKVEKAAEDSTWTVSNKNLEYWFLGDSSYPTDYTITARMLPETTITSTAGKSQSREKDVSGKATPANSPRRKSLSPTRSGTRDIHGAAARGN